jgi:hypothetical protein
MVLWLIIYLDMQKEDERPKKKEKREANAIDNVMEELRLEKELREKNVAAGTVTPP